MSLILDEGFDLLTTGSLTTIGGWILVGSGGSNGTQTMVSGRVSGTGQALQLTMGNNVGFGYRQGLNGSFGTLIAGCAFIWQGGGSGAVTILAFSDTGTTQTDLRVNTSGQLLVTRNGTTLATSTATLHTGTWYYIELSVTFGSSGSYAVRVNESVFGGLSDASGINTIATANSSANQFTIGGSTATGTGVIWDDVYVCSSAGALNNTFLGDIEVRTLRPTAVGSNSNFIRTGGSSGGNFTAVNETLNDSDSSYVSAQTPGTIDTYNYADLPTNTSSVLAVVGHFVARKDVSAGRHVTTHYRTLGGSEFDFTAADLNLSTSYQLMRQIQETDPNTGVAWTVSNTNGGEFGPNISS